jgi:hypothetical protein
VSAGGRRRKSMNWFRSRIQSGARLMLFALVFQMAVSFGHMHRDDLGLPPLPESDDVRSASQIPGPTAARDHRPASDDYCPICASMVLIATAVPSLPPVLIVPEPIRREWSSEMPAGGVSLEVALSFQARASPAV